MGKRYSGRLAEEIDAELRADETAADRYERERTDDLARRRTAR